MNQLKPETGIPLRFSIKSSRSSVWCPAALQPVIESRVLALQEPTRSISHVTDRLRTGAPSDCRGRYGASGDFLFGAFGAADAMFALVVTRLDTYGVDLDETCAAYSRAVLTLPAFVE